MTTGDQQTVYDTDSINIFDVQANALGWPHTDLHLVHDADVERLIRQVLKQQKDDYIGVSSVTVDADQDPVHLYGILCTLASKGLGSTATFSVHWEHPNGETFNQSVRVIGFHFVVTMEGGQAKMTGEVRCVRNQGPTYSAADWVTATAYAAGRVVKNGGVLYVCTAGHTSGTDEDQPGVGAEWHDFWELV